MTFGCIINVKDYMFISSTMHIYIYIHVHTYVTNLHLSRIKKKNIDHLIRK